MKRRATGRRAAPARDRILDAALKSFAEKGFVGTTTKEIAKRARVNEVTVFRLFGSKHALFVAVMTERSLNQIKQEIALETDGPIGELIAGNLRTVLQALRANKSQYMVMLGDAWRQPKTRALIGEMSMRRGLELATGRMRSLMDAGRIRRMDPEVAARALMGMVQSYFLMNDLMEGRKQDQAQDDRVVDGFVSVFLDGMRADDGGGGA
jgi:AcrR family transcriptional regulator